MALDGLTDAFDHLSMGESTERSGRKLGITREEQDEFAAASHQRAAAAAKNGLFAAEIVPVPVPQRGGEQLNVTEDEGIRPGTTVETLAKLKPAFGADGTITAGTASQISDGAAAVVVMSAQAAAGPARTSWPRSARTATSPGRTTRCTLSPRTPSGRPWPRPGSISRTWT